MGAVTHRRRQPFPVPTRKIAHRHPREPRAKTCETVQPPAATAPPTPGAEGSSPPAPAPAPASLRSLRALWLVRPRPSPAHPHPAAPPSTSHPPPLDLPSPRRRGRPGHNTRHPGTSPSPRRGAGALVESRYGLGRTVRARVPRPPRRCPPGPTHGCTVACGAAPASPSPPPASSTGRHPPSRPRRRWSSRRRPAVPGSPGGHAARGCPPCPRDSTMPDVGDRAKREDGA